MKLPVLFLTPGLKRRTRWPDADDPEQRTATVVPKFAEAGSP
jgi:hypothetical protein